MAERIDIDISAKDGASASLQKVAEEGESLGERMKKAAASIYVVKEAFNAVVSVGKKIVDFGAEMVNAWGVQEKAERDLIAAHNAMGEAGEKYIEDEKRIAAAIQDETGVGDDVTLQRMARAKALGVETNRLEECAKGVIALTNVGMSEEAATRALAQAYAGNYGALERYIPALKEAADETDKQAALNDFLTQGYERQSATLDTVQGSWAALQNSIGDAKEVVGKAIVENTNLSGVFQQMGNKVQDLSAKMADWCQNGGLARAIMTAKIFFENIKAGVTIGVTYVGKFYEAFKLFVIGPWKVAYDAAGAFWKSIVEGAKYAGDWCKYLWDRITGKDAQKPDTSKVKEAWGEMIDAAVNSTQKQIDAFKDGWKNMDAVADEVRKNREANIEAIGDAYFKKMDEIREKSAQTGESIADAASTAGTKTVEAVEKTAKATIDNTKRAAAEAEKELKRLQGEADKANAALKGMTNKKSRDDDKERQRQAKEARKQERENEKYQKRMAEYLRRWEDGGNLSQKQNRELNEWLKMRKAAADAQQALNAAKNNPLLNQGGGGNGPQGGAAQGGNPAQPQGAQGIGVEGMLAKILEHTKSMDGTLNKCLRIG